MHQVKCRDCCMKKKHPRSHWTRKRGAWKPKRVFSSTSEAQAYILKRHMVGYSSYICPECGKIHIGLKKSE